MSEDTKQLTIITTAVLLLLIAVGALGAVTCNMNHSTVRNALNVILHMNV